MQTVATIGLDIAKSIFQVHGVDAGGQLVIHRRLIANPEPSTHGCTDQCCKREESSCQPGAVHTWPIGEASACPLGCRLLGR